MDRGETHMTKDFVKTTILFLQCMHCMATLTQLHL